MNTAIPQWAQQLLCDPADQTALSIVGTSILSCSGVSYEIREGVPVFCDVESSYQNKATSRPRVDARNPTIAAFSGRSTIFDEYGPQMRGKVVVDMCSGGGMPSYYLASKYGCRVISVERAFNAIKYYGDQFRDYYNISDEQVVRICADAAKLPIRDESVDFVVGSSWVHHFVDQTKVLTGAFRVLRPDGLLLAHNEGVAGWVAFGTSDEDHYTSPVVYKRSLEAAGFVNARVRPWSRKYWLARWFKASVDLIGVKPRKK